MDNTAALLSFALIIVISAVFLAFSQEFIQMVRKIASKPAMMLLLPLVLASWLIEIYEQWGRWLLLWCRAHLHLIINRTAQLLPFQTGSLLLIRIVSLFLLACFPAWLFWFKAKYKGEIEPPVFVFYFGVMLWIVAVFLLLVQD